MSEQSVVLVVDDDPLNVKLLINILESDYEILFALDGYKAIELAGLEQPDLILLDVMMPDQSGYETCEQLKAKHSTSDIPIIFISSLSDHDDETKGLSCGAIDYITKPVKAAIVKARVSNHLELKHARDILKQQASVDQLTNIANRRRFDEFLLQSWRTMQREAKPLSVIMIDIDYFKPFNDFYGHGAGDEGLKKVAKAMQQIIARPSDLLARYGGEEFVCILPDTDEEGGLYIAEELRQAVQNLEIPHQHSKANSVVTISQGLATTIPTSDKLLSNFMNSSDYALYQAKELGRNRVELAIA
ncbi:MAG: diguanylate cyclase [Methylococcaceae bacterium]|nr:diguanylate cyclase [Methylococcaceae bacterium]